MDAHTFLDNFAMIADAPGGVERLRRICLRLAVSGQLRTNNPSDEPAIASVKRAAPTIAAQARTAGRSASSAHLAGDAALFVGKPSLRGLPPGWELVPLTSVARLESGHTPDRKVTAYWDGDIPWIGIRDARTNRDGTILSTEKAISQAGVDNSSTRLLPTGTVCLSRTASVGYSTVMGRPMCTSQDFVNFVCTEALAPRYLQLVFMAEQDALKRFAKGAVHLTIYFPEVKAFHLALPPTEEQKRIVATAEDLLRQCDELVAGQARRALASTKFRRAALAALVHATTTEELRASWERVSHNWHIVSATAEGIPDLRSTILKLATGGLLTDQDPSEQPAAELLASIFKAQEERKKVGALGGVRTPVPAPTESAPLPPGWAWTRLGAVLGYCRNGLASKPNEEGIGFRILRISAGTSDPDGVADLSDYKFTDVSPEVAAPYQLEPGDLIACRFNGNLKYVARVAIVPEHDQICLHPDKLIRMTGVGVDNRYLAIALNSPGTRAQVEKVASTTAGNIGINGAQLQALQIPLPPLPEQTRIADRVDELFRLSSGLARGLPNAEEASERAAAAITSQLLHL